MKKHKNSNSSMDYEELRSEKVLIAHRELCTLSANEENLRSLQREKSFTNWLLKVSGLEERGRVNYLNIETVENQVCIPSLPDELIGLRILQLGSLHFSNHDELLNILFSSVKTIEYDICILTGGIGLGLKNDVLLKNRVELLMKALNGNVYGVLGMGDTSQSIEIMREMGIIVLNNEFSTITLMDRTIELFGGECASALIDPSFESRIRTFNLADLRIFVSANPQFRVQASKLEFDLMLTGVQSCRHCLYKAVCRFDRAARRYAHVNNDWQINGLHGYTSSGLGRNYLDAKFRSRPEVVLHEFVNYNYL